MKNVYLVDDMLISEQVRKAILSVLDANQVKYTRIDLHASRCPVCGLKMGKESRTVALFAEMVHALSLVFAHCGAKGDYHFTRKEIKEEVLAKFGENVTARFGDWKLFGGLIYTPENEGKEKKGQYAFNVERTVDFLNNRLAIPTKLVLYKDGREMENLDYKTRSQIQSLEDLLVDGKYTNI